MMKPTRPQISKGGSYPQEFRDEAVRYWLSSGHTLALVVADLGLSPACLRSWRKQLEATATGLTASNTTPGLTLARENGQLRRELEAMMIHSMIRQRDILPSAISIFSESTLNGGLK